MVTGNSTILLAWHSAMAGTGTNNASTGGSNRNTRMAGLGAELGGAYHRGNWKKNTTPFQDESQHNAMCCLGKSKSRGLPCAARMQSARQPCFAQWGELG